jgi:hypothetical protein
LAVTIGFGNLQRCRTGKAHELLISPFAGEMSGRTEGGAKDLGLATIGLIDTVAAP